MSNLERLKKLTDQSKHIKPEFTEKRNAKGVLNVHQRIELLFDTDSFVEIDGLKTHRCAEFNMQSNIRPGDGIVTGYGTVDGRKIFIAAQDFSYVGGSFSEAQSQKVAKIYDLAMKVGAPVICINDSGGARIQEGIASLHGYAALFRANTKASGVIPQLSMIAGPCAGGAVYSPGLTDFIFMVEDSSYMFLTGPEVVKSVTREEVTMEDLGGASCHGSVSGVAHYVCKGDADAIFKMKKLLTYLPQNSAENPPSLKEFTYTGDCNKLLTIIPENSRRPYDIRDVVKQVVDDESFFEVGEKWARNMVVGFARLEGKVVGVIGNQPKMMAGAIDINASDKGARFVRFCDAFNIPLMILVDVPGFMPGKMQEQGGIIRHGAKLLYAFAEASVPKVTFIIRKAYGGAYCVMSPKSLGGDINYASPIAEIAVMGAEGAVNIIKKRDIDASEDPAAARKSFTDDYTEKFQNPFVAASLGYIDEVIEFPALRKRFTQAFAMLENKVEIQPRKKHGNIPL